MAYVDTSKIRIPWRDFNELYGPMVLYFRVKTNEQIDRSYHRKVAYFPKQCLESAVRTYMDRNKPMPGNFPSPNDLASICADWLYNKPKLKESITLYDTEEDFDFPVGYLNNAFKILDEYGDRSFMAYCKRVRMPTCDIERVRNKQRVVYSREQVQKKANGIGEWRRR